MANTNLKTILTDLYSITSGTWNKLSDFSIKTFESSKAISGNVDTNGVLRLGVNVSDLVDTGDVTNALKVKDNGLYVGLPLAQNGSFGLVKAGTGVTIADGVLSVSLQGVGSADAVKSPLTVFGTAWNGSSTLTLKIADNDKYIKATKSGDIITISSQNIGENSGTTNYLTGKTIVWDGLRALDTAIKTVSDTVNNFEIPAVPVYSIAKVATETGYAATYQLTKDGVKVGDSINIFKDQFLKDAVIVKGNLSGTSFTEDQTNGKYYIKFTFELSGSDSDKVIYLDASSLVNVDEITQVKKVEDFEDSTISALGLTVDTLLFKENGETRIYNAEIGGLIDCSEETVTSIDETTDLNLIPTVGAIRDYVDEIKETAGAGSIEKVTAISNGPSDTSKVTLLFTAAGETGIWDAAEQKLVDISDETTSSITDETADTLLPNVGAVKGYFATFDAELADLKAQFDTLKGLIG